MPRCVVTGAGSGFGFATTQRLRSQGYEVVAMDRHLHLLRAAFPDEDDGLTRVAVDLADGTAVDRVTSALTREGSVDAVVLNAGYAVFNTLEDGDPAAVEAMFATNVLGTARLLRGLWGAVREASGTVVVVSSVAGRMVFPESGFYAATKHAVEALAESWYIENVDAGVRVAVVEPGAFATGFADRARRESQPRGVGGRAREAFERWDEAKACMLAPPQPASWVAEAVSRCLVEGPAFQRVAVGADARAILRAREALGADRFVRWMGDRARGGRGAESEAPLSDGAIQAVVDAGMTSHLDAPWPGGGSDRSTPPARQP